MAEVTGQNIDPVMEKPWQRAKRFERYEYFRKSAYPPMEIEPMRDERSRLVKEMTTEERALRKQWVKDQILKNEMRHVPEVTPHNIIRRFYRYPGDALIAKPLTKAGWNKTVVAAIRYSIPKTFVVGAATLAIWYHLKYNQNTWMRCGGWVMQYGKCIVPNENWVWPDKTPEEFYDRGFKDRKALLYKPKES